jgi:putative membrane protein
MSEPVTVPVDPRNYLAAERTFLAWLRTGIALMGFGFVVARFGLFLRELATAEPGAKEPNAGFSMPVGVFLILLGIWVMIMSAIRHHRFIQALDRGEFRQTFNSALGFWLTGFLVLVGIAVAVYLVAVF